LGCDYEARGLRQHDAKVNDGDDALFRSIITLVIAVGVSSVRLFACCGHKNTNEKKDRRRWPLLFLDLIKSLANILAKANCMLHVYVL